METADSKKFVHYAGALFLLVAATVAIWQMLGPSWFKNIRAEITSQPYARTITVNGDAKVSAVPDIATISLSVVSEGKNVKEVTTDGNAKMTKIHDGMLSLGVERKDMTTTQYSLTPVYDYQVMPVQFGSARKTPKITGYRLDQQLTLKIRDLTRVDDVIDRATQLGANEVGQLSFDIDDTSAVKKEAREKAFQAARDKAEQMAAAVGVRLSRVVTFSEDNFAQPMYANYAVEKAALAPMDAPAPSIQPGSKELRVNVSVTYEIE